MKKNTDPVSQRNLALIGSMNDEAINKDELLSELIAMLKDKAGEVMQEKYGIEGADDIA